MDDLRQARSLLERTPALKQKRPAAMALHGVLLLESQLYDELASWFAEADESWQRYPEFWLAVGGLAIQRQEFHLAVRAFSEAIVREPCDAAAVDRLTQALQANGDVTAAVAFRERSEDIKGLDELTGEILNNPRIATAAFAIVSRELRKMGQEFEAYSWELLGRQRQGLVGGAVRDDPDARRQLIASADEAEIRRKRLCNLGLDNDSADFSTLAAAEDANANTHLTMATSTPSLANVGPRFANVAGPSGLEFKYVNADPPVRRYFLLHQALGAGIACLDYDLDGNSDLYVAQGAGNPPDIRGLEPNLLARNLGGTFEAVTAPAACDDRGYSMGLTAGDFNQDGFPDLVVGNMGSNRLLINQGDGSFRPHSGDAIWSDGKYTTGLAIADVTGDHLPDIFEVNYTDDIKIFEPIRFAPAGRPMRLPGPRQFDASVDRLFTSVGDGSLVGHELDSRGSAVRRYGMGLLVTDIDGDGDNEVFVANDQTANNLWDPGDDTSAGKLADVAVIKGVAYAKAGGEAACMGIAAADFDFNGLIDLHVTNFDDEWSNQYMQSQDHVFTDLALPYGVDVVSRGLLGFGTQAIDYDNDSIADLVIGNGHIEDLQSRGSLFRMPTQVLAGSGDSFRAMSVEGDHDYWQQKHLSRCLVALDWNNDGRVDFAVTDLTEPLALLENQTNTSHHWLQLHLVGTNSERDAIGATVTIELGDQTRTGFVQTGDGYMGKNQPMVHFGLGESTVVDRIEVRWPSGSKQRWTDVGAESTIAGRGRQRRTV